VLDASVGVKFVVEEEGTEKAQALIKSALEVNGPKIYVPDIFFAECSNVLWKHVRRLGLPVQEAKAQLTNLSIMPFQTISTPPLVAEAFDASMDLGIPAYDALYVVCAG